MQVRTLVLLAVSNASLILRLPCNSKKNRYRDVGCLDRNRVKLNRVHGKEVSELVTVSSRMSTSKLNHVPFGTIPYYS